MLLPLIISLSLAQAVGPERQAASLTVGGGEVRHIQSTRDGELVSMVVSSQVVVLDTRTWSQRQLSPCVVTAATWVEDAADDLELWVGCDDGAVRAYGLRDGDLLPIIDIGEEGVLSPLDDRVLGLHAGQGMGDVPSVFVVGLNQDSEQIRIVTIDAVAAQVGTTARTQFEGYGGSAVGDTHLYVTHNSAYISSLALLSGLPQFNLGGAQATFTSVAPTTRGSALIVNRRDDGSVVEHNGFTAMYQPVLLPARGIQAVGNYRPLDEEEAGFVLLAYSDRIDVWRESEGGLSGDNRLRTFGVEGTIRSLHAAEGGYGFAGTTGGRLLVLTDRPWLDALSLSSDRVIEGDMLQLAFQSDRAGDYEVALGGTARSGGQILATGTAGVGEERVDLSVADWGEGTSWLYVRLTDSQGRSGHVAAQVTVDARPRAVTLGPGSVGFDDGLLRLSFAQLESADVARYTVYVTTEPFTPEAWPAGGPDYVGPDDLEAPIVVAPTAENPIVVSIEPVTNNVSYYLAVRATDEGGLEGTMSQVVEGRPRPTQTAAQLAAETGGFDCNSTASRGAGLGLVALVLGLMRRRRSRRASSWIAQGAAALGLGLATLVVATPALAFQDEDGDGIDDRLEERDEARGDLTDAWANLEVRYGTMNLTDENLTSVYGEGGNNVLFVEIGPQIYRFLELDFGAGFVQELAFTVDEQGNPGSRRTMITAVPLTVSPTLRLHILDEQFIVPYASGGIDWWLWNEKVDNASGAKDTISGSKFGYHWSVGANLLLDTFSPSRASMLEAQSGINDSWFTVEFRRQMIDGEQGLSFSADVITAGLKFDF